MAAIQQLLDDIDLRYRNTFTTAQKLVWMNEEQRELFEVIELDSVPFSFSTVSGFYSYPIPDGVEKDRIKVITIDVSGNSDFIDVPFIENDDNRYAPAASYWYTILEDNFYINFPSTPPGDRTVYIYLDQQPEDISASDLSVEPAVPVRYQELLKLGTLKRIAAARKDTIMYSNYSDTYEDKLSQMMEKMALQIPEFHTPVDMLPKRSRNRRTGRYVQYVTINNGS
jgi:hypothetical protein